MKHASQHYPTSPRPCPRDMRQGPGALNDRTRVRTSQGSGGHRARQAADRQFGRGRARAHMAVDLVACVRQGREHHPEFALEKAGFTVELDAVEGKRYACYFDAECQTGTPVSWMGPDWPNASTVISPLFTQSGGWDISRVGMIGGDPDPNSPDKDFVDAVIANLGGETDRQAQATEWQRLDGIAGERHLRHPDVLRPHAEHRGQQGRQPVPLGSLRLMAVWRPLRAAVRSPNTGTESSAPGKQISRFPGAVS